MRIPRPPRGFRDFPPEIMILRKRLFSLLEGVFQRYGFDPIDTPAVEYWETLSGKYGEEAENRLIWRFEDPWSGREYALRYDLTVPLARFIASHRDVQMPFKRYHIGPVWRHEEPQRGRYREFYQCDADIVGSPFPEADAEIVELTIDALKALGFNSGFRVRINDRRLLKGVFEQELSLASPLPVYRAIDKLDKIGLDGVVEELKGLELDSGKINKIIDIIGIRGGPSETLHLIENKYKNNKLIIEAIDHFRTIIELVDNDQLVEIDLSLVRGLDYYTGPIIEVVLERPKIGSVAGGGRYDSLIGMFINQDIPATGVSIGIERIIDAGIELGIYSLSRKTLTDANIIVLDRNHYNYAWTVARRLREEGVSTRIDLSRASHRVQRRKAQRLGIKYLVFVGEREAANRTVTVYDVETGERREVKIEDIGKVFSRH